MVPPSTVWARFSRRKQLDAPGEGEHASKLDKCLNTFDLTALGIGATLGESGAQFGTLVLVFVVLLD